MKGSQLSSCSTRNTAANARDELASKVAQALAQVSNKLAYIDTIHVLIPSLPSKSDLAAITEGKAGAIFPVKLSNPVWVRAKQGLLPHVSPHSASIISD